MTFKEINNVINGPSQKESDTVETTTFDFENVTYFEKNGEIKMDEKKFKEFEEVCKPVIDFLRKNYNTMCKAIISDGFCEVVSSEMGLPNKVED